MAFFTRVNTNVPFLLPEHCHPSASDAICSQIENNTHGVSSSSSTKCVGDDEDKIDDDLVNIDDKKDDSGNRYEYVVDRVLGVEV